MSRVCPPCSMQHENIPWKQKEEEDEEEKMGKRIHNGLMVYDNISTKNERKSLTKTLKVALTYPNEGIFKGNLNYALLPF